MYASPNDLGWRAPTSSNDRCELRLRNRAGIANDSQGDVRVVVRNDGHGIVHCFRFFCCLFQHNLLAISAAAAEQITFRPNPLLLFVLHQGWYGIGGESAHAEAVRMRIG